MKQITPLPIWDNGQTVEATVLNAYGISQTLGFSATFYWALLSENNQTLTQGNIILEGEDYQTWGEDDEYVWDYIAQKLNLQIIGDYPLAQIS